METDLKTAAVAGYERVAAWADLLDDINVYPVPDADTGRNLKISLAPIIKMTNAHEEIGPQLLQSATGNSGNIAAAYFCEFLNAESAAQLPGKAAAASERARAAIADPQPGTMLTVFEHLSRVLEKSPDSPAPAEVTDALVAAVHTTHDLLPELSRAGVVDSGALGMFLFFEGFFKTLYDKKPAFISLANTFGEKLKLQEQPEGPAAGEVCINTLIKTDGDSEELSRRLQSVGDSIVTVREGDHLKIHMHARELDTVRQKLESWGDLITWDTAKIQAGATARLENEQVHIVTDAAGSITRETAERLGITLMDSYIIFDDRACPETAVVPETLYRDLRAGRRITTAQASLFERHQSYESLASRFDRVLYLCVGSAYTGIYESAKNWQMQTVRSDVLTVLDSGAASGRLGLIAIAVAEFANQSHPLGKVAAYAETAFETCIELVFLDQLKYLAAGGRISKASGFFGDLLSVKPVISPLAEGVQKVGKVRKNSQQVPLAIDFFKKRIEPGTKVRMLLQYTDNLERVTDQIQPAIQAAFPEAKITLTPLSLTSGVHMGPGTWAIAVLPEFAL
jgi:DegV family protein with EDD domain